MGGSSRTSNAAGQTEALGFAVRFFLKSCSRKCLSEWPPNLETNGGLTQTLFQRNIIQVGTWMRVQVRLKRTGPVRAGRRT